MKKLLHEIFDISLHDIRTWLMQRAARVISLPRRCCCSVRPQRSQLAQTPLQRLEFWGELPFCLLKAALEIAILFTSSEFCTTSEDVRETSVMMRFNENQRGGRSRFAERSRLS